MLTDYRDQLVRERTKMISRLRWHLHDRPPDLAPDPRVLARPAVRRITQARCHPSASSWPAAAGPPATPPGPAWVTSSSAT